MHLPQIDQVKIIHPSVQFKLNLLSAANKKLCPDWRIIRTHNQVNIPPLKFFKGREDVNLVANSFACIFVMRKLLIGDNSQQQNNQIGDNSQQQNNQPDSTPIEAFEPKLSVAEQAIATCQYNSTIFCLYELGPMWLTHRVISDRVHRLLVTLSYFRPDRFVQLLSLIPILILLLYYLVSGCLTSLC